MFDFDKDEIYDTIIKIIGSHDNEFLEFFELRELKTFYSIMFMNTLIFKISQTADGYYVHLREKYIDSLPQHFSTEDVKIEPSFIKVPINSIADAIALKSIYITEYEKVLKKISGQEFDCCSHYLECSNAKACVNIDKQFAFGCSYHFKLKNGIIFYGDNRNITAI